MVEDTNNYNNPAALMIIGVIIVVILIFALSLRRQIRRSKDGNEYIKFGTNQEHRNKIREAMLCYINAEKVFAEAGDEGGRAKAFCLCGLAELKRGDPKEALRYFRKAEPIARESSTPDDLGFLLLSLGDVEDELGRAEKSRKYYTEAMELYKEMGDDDGVMFARDKLGLEPDGDEDIDDDDED